MRQDHIDSSGDASAIERHTPRPKWTLVVNVSGVRCDGEPPLPSAAMRSPPTAMRDATASATRPRAQRSRSAAKRTSASTDDDGGDDEANVGRLLARQGSARPTQRLLTVPDIATMMGVSEKAVWHRHYRGQIPGLVRVGASVYFRRDEVLRFLSEGRGPSPRSR